MESKWRTEVESSDALDRHLQQIYLEHGIELHQPSRAAMPSTTMKAKKKRRTEFSAVQVEEHVKHLDGIPILQGLLRGEKMQIAQHMTEMDYGQGEVIVTEGDVGDCFYVLFQGECAVFKGGHKVGTYQADPATGKSAYFGERALLMDEPRAASIVVVSDGAKVLKMGRESFNATLGPLEDFLVHATDDINEREDSRLDTHDEQAGDPLSMGGQNVGTPRAAAWKEEEVGSSAHGKQAGDRFSMGGQFIGSPRVAAWKAEAGRGSTVVDGHVQKTSPSWDSRIDNMLWARGLSPEQMLHDLVEHNSECKRRMQRWPLWRIQAHRLSELMIFDIGTVTFIVINIMCLALAVSVPKQERQTAMIASQICKIFFFGEMFVRLAGCPSGRGWYLESGLVVDSILLFVAVIEMCCYVFGDGTYTVRNVLAVLQSVRLYRLLDMLQHVLTPLRLMTRTLHDSLSNIVSTLVFVGFVCLIASFTFTMIVVAGSTSVDLENEPEEVQRAAENLGGVGRSLLTIITITAGGICWGQNILNPLLRSEYLSYKLCGMGLFTLGTLSQFNCWNLVLGVYVKQIISLSAEDECELGNQQDCRGHRDLHGLKRVLQKADLDGDGCVSHTELLKAIAADKKTFEQMDLRVREVEALHSFMSLDGTGSVPVSDLVFGVPMLRGASKMREKLNIDLQQKMLRRGLSVLHASSYEQLDALMAELDVLVEGAQLLNEKIAELQDDVSRVQRDLRVEIKRQQRLAWQKSQTAALSQVLQKVRYKQEVNDVHQTVAAQIDELRAELGRLSLVRNLNILATAGPTDLAALRQVIQHRVDVEVQPWLEKELANAVAANLQEHWR